MFKAILTITLLVVLCSTASATVNITDIPKLSAKELKAQIEEKGCEFSVINTKFERVSAFVPATSANFLINGDISGIEAFSIPNTYCNCKVRSVSKESGPGIPESAKIKVKRDYLTYKVPFLAKSLSITCGVY